MEFQHAGLADYLICNYHYTEEEAEQLLYTAGKMKPENRRLLADWAEGKGGLEKTVKGISGFDLTGSYGMNPVQAIVTLDWLERNPRAAISFLTHPHDRVVAQADRK